MAKAIPLGSVVYVRYLDHVLFQNVPNRIEEPAERETVGWLTKDEKGVVCIENDRTLHKLPYSSGSGSGLVLLKSCIIEIRLVPIQNRAQSAGVIRPLTNHPLAGNEFGNVRRFILSGRSNGTFRRRSGGGKSYYRPPRYLVR